MKRDLIKYQLDTSFLAYEKDIETILKKLFIENQPYSDVLKKLLIVNTPDCLEPNIAYDNLVKTYSIQKMKEAGYIKIVPTMKNHEFETVKSYMLISLDNFTPSGNPQFRDCTLSFDIICQTDCWDIGNYRIRPMKIAGYIDGLLNNSKLSGIGVVNFLGCNELILNEHFAGYTLMYTCTHGSDDRIPPKDE